MVLNSNVMIKWQILPDDKYMYSMSEIMLEWNVIILIMTYIVF